MNRKWIGFVGLMLCLLLNTFTATGQTNRGATNVKVKKNNGKIEEIKLYDASYALVIGNGNYKNGWDNLPGVESDVVAVQNVLEQQGFIVETTENLTSRELTGRIQQFIDDYGYQPNNRLLIYYAGHGHTLKSTGDGRDLGYIVPIDAPNPSKDEINFKRRAIPMDDIQNFAKKIQAKHALFVFDSCFSGKLVTRNSIVVPPVIQENVAYAVRQFITAGSANQFVPDESIFRRSFVRGLEGEADLNRDGYITGTELAEYLKDKVTNYSDRRQTPQYGKINDIELDRGDFVFVLPKEPVIAVTSNTESTAFPSKTKIENTGGNSNLSPKVSPVKVAVIDTSLFADEKRGITQFINAYKQLEKEFTPRRNEITNKEAKLKKLKQDYDNSPPGDYKQQLLQEGERLQQEYNLDVERYKEAVKKREATLVGPIYQQIGKSLSEMEKQNGVSLLDISKDQEAYIVWSDQPLIDKTTEAFINSYSKGASPPYIDIPLSKIGSIDTSLFADEKTGISQFVNAYKQLEKEFSSRKGEQYKTEIQKREATLVGPIYQQLGKALQQYAKENGFYFIVDVSKKISPDLAPASSMPKIDVSNDITRQFIDYYNRLNP